SDGAREATPKNMLAHRKDNAKCRASPRNATGTPPVKASAPSKPLATICSRRTGATPLYAAKEIAKMMSSAPATEPPRSTADAYDRFKMPCFKRHAAGEAAVHWPWRGDEWARARRREFSNRFAGRGRKPIAGKAKAPGPNLRETARAASRS